MRKVNHLRVRGPLAAYADGYRMGLASLGYTPNSVESQIWAMAQVSRWLEVQHLTVADLTSARVEQFLTGRREKGCRQPLSRRKLKPLLAYLRSLDALPPEASGTVTDELVERYRRYLLEERDLAPRTIVEYESLAKKFLNEHCRSNERRLELHGLTGADVTGFLLREASRLTPGAAKNRVAQLRSLLRFLYINDLIAADLAVSIPPIAGWRQTRLPATLTASQVRALLDSCDRSYATGLRDFAILTVLARLGLRASEVANLQLGDVDWRAGEILVRGKGRRNDRLPLPVDVGAAIVAYLRDGRPRSEWRSLFLTSHAPLQGIQRAGISDVVHRASERIGMPPVRAHLLRHTLASEMLRRGVALRDIAQVLRHRDLATTAVYAKIDRNALRSVAQPWPGIAR